MSTSIKIFLKITANIYCDDSSDGIFQTSTNSQVLVKYTERKNS